MKSTKTILITGAARRVGAVIAEHLHSLGFSVMVHCHTSVNEAQKLVEKLNALRACSAKVSVLDLGKVHELPQLVQQVIDDFGRLDVLINNASVFYPTDLQHAKPSVWDDMMDCNAKAPFFLSQAAYPYLKETKGQIINITDVHASRPLKDYGFYTMSKALLLHQTKCLAKEWGPDIRVNAIAPGPVLWPEGVNVLDETAKARLIEKTALKKQVNPFSIAQAADFLIQNEDMTGKVIEVDAGRYTW